MLTAWCGLSLLTYLLVLPLMRASRVSSRELPRGLAVPSSEGVNTRYGGWKVLGRFGSFATSHRALPW